MGPVQFGRLRLFRGPEEPLGPGLNPGRVKFAHPVIGQARVGMDRRRCDDVPGPDEINARNLRQTGGRVFIEQMTAPVAASRLRFERWYHRGGALAAVLGVDIDDANGRRRKDADIGVGPPLPPHLDLRLVGRGVVLPIERPPKVSVKRGVLRRTERALVARLKREHPEASAGVLDRPIPELHTSSRNAWKIRNFPWGAVTSSRSRSATAASNVA